MEQFKWNFSKEVEDVIQKSIQHVFDFHCASLGTEHILLALLKGDYEFINDFFEYCGIDIETFSEEVKRKITLSSENVEVMPKSIPFLKQTNSLFNNAQFITNASGNSVIEISHLFLALAQMKDNFASKMLQNHDITPSKIKNYAQEHKGIALNSAPSRAQKDDDAMDDDMERNPRMDANRPQRPKTKSRTPNLNAYGRDLNKAAEEGKLDPVVGREKELERITQILSRRKKNNPILIGEPGVGKSAIAEGLALKIVNKQVPRILLDKRIVMLDLGSMVAGTKFRGEFEERVKAVLDEVYENPNIILFIDEIHTIVGAGSASGSLDASNMFKPALARGELQCIGATTLDEYRKNIESDGALDRRFQQVLVEPTGPEETILILNNIKSKYEDHHHVTFTDEAIKACITLTQRYIPDKYLPDKAIDVMDEAGARVHISKIVVPENILDIEQQLEEAEKNKIMAVNATEYEKAAAFRDTIKQLKAELDNAKAQWEAEADKQREIVTEDIVADVVAMMTGIPMERINKDTSTRLSNMENELKSSVIGQDEAISKIAKAIRRNKLGLKDPNKPIGSFLFLGPTGVGKTFLCKVLAKYLFDSEDAIVRVDMSEYMEKFAITRLIGAPPGYVGYEEGGGQLTEKVRRKPYSIVLLDEIEKAHPDVYNLLLQVFDEGHLTDSLGRKVDFKNTIIIMTSNIGSRQVKDFGAGVGFSTAARQENYNKNIQKVIQDALSKQFAPEFINRLDDIIIFNSLKREDIHNIIDIEIKHVYKRLEDMKIHLTLDNTAKDYIADKGWDASYGARPLKRALQQYVEDVISEEIINGTVKENDAIVLKYDETEDKMIVSR